MIDEILEVIVNSPDRKSLAAGARTAGPLLLHQHYVIPMYYGKQYFIAHKRKLRRPKRHCRNVFSPARRC